MTTTLIAVYDEIDDARDAVRDLLDSGFHRNDIGVAARDHDTSSDDDVEAGEGAAFGAVTGGVLGVVAGLATITIPGIGPVLATGSLAGALAAAAGGTAGAVSGAATGGVTAALVDLGMSEDEADYHAENLRRGSALVAVAVSENAYDQAVAILDKHHPIDMDQRLEDWRREGWNGFDPIQKPYTREQVSEERRQRRGQTGTSTQLVKRVIHIQRFKRTTPPAPSLGSLGALFQQQLLDVYSAERQLVEALPKMAEGATAPELEMAFREHLEATRAHVAAVRKLLEARNLEPGEETCEAMRGLIREGEQIIEAEGDSAARDAGLIAIAQKIEHYEIASYGCLRTWANTLGATDVATALQVILDQEYEADRALTVLAEALLNPAATKS